MGANMHRSSGHFWRRAVFCALTTAALALTHSSASAAAYTILDLGTLGGSSSYCAGFGAVNTLGQVVGYANISGNVALHAFRTPTGGAMGSGSDLGTLG